MTMPPAILDTLSPLSQRQREEQDQAIDDLRKALEAERQRFEQKCKQIKADHADRLATMILDAAFDEQHGGMTGRDRARISVAKRTVMRFTAEVENGLEVARRKAKPGQTPVVLVAEMGTVRTDRSTPVERVLLVADVSQIMPSDD